MSAVDPKALPAIYRAGNNVITDAYELGIKHGEEQGRDKQARDHHQWLLGRDEQFAQVAAEARREALLDAAAAWESSSIDSLRDMAERLYMAGGPSMPTIWLRLRAEEQTAAVTS